MVSRPQHNKKTGRLDFRQLAPIEQQIKAGLEAAEVMYCDETGLRLIVERYEQPWAEKMMTLLSEIKAQVDIAKAEEKSALSAMQLSDFEMKYQTLLMAGFEANLPLPVDDNAPKKRGRVKQSPPKNLLDRLDLHDTAVLAFMFDFRVPFDNNQAERDVRMMKLKQKISGCFRSATGSQQFCRIRGYISTLRKQGLAVIDALRRTFTANPMLPAFLLTSLL